MASKRNVISDPNSCLNQAADNEMLFVLRANDEIAPFLVREWAYRYYTLKGGAQKMTAKQLHKYYEALNCATFMERWRESHPEFSPRQMTQEERAAMQCALEKSMTSVDTRQTNAPHASTQMRNCKHGMENSKECRECKAEGIC